jgi:hypothetical protein
VNMPGPSRQSSNPSRRSSSPTMRSRESTKGESRVRKSGRSGSPPARKAPPRAKSHQRKVLEGTILPPGVPPIASRRKARSMSPRDLLRRGRSMSLSRTRPKSNATKRRSHSPTTLCREIEGMDGSKLPMRGRKSDGGLERRNAAENKNSDQVDRKGGRRANDRDRSTPVRRSRSNSRDSAQLSSHSRISHDGSVYTKTERSGHMRKVGDNVDVRKGERRPSSDDLEGDKVLPMDEQTKPHSKLRIIAPGASITWFRFCSYLIPILILVCAGVGIVVATGNTPDAVSNAIGNLIPSLDNSELKDPFSGNLLPKWAEDGNGLRVTIVNALSDDWQVSFDLAVADWDLGSPDAVDITVEVVSHEIACTAELGKVKVCNGNYGDTKWRGVNEAMFDKDNRIVETAIRMNEFYLLHMDKGAWQYTMCHEIGTIIYMCIDTAVVSK